MRKDNDRQDSLCDKELLCRIKKYDRMAFDSIYMKYHRDLFVFACNIIKNRDDASDIIQEVFLKIWEHGDLLPEDINFKSYLYSMTRNRVLNYIRNYQTRLVNNYSLFVDRGMYENAEVLDLADKKEMHALLDDAIDSLPVQQKVVAKERRKGVSNSDIAENMGLSLNTVNVHYRLAIKALRTKMKDLKTILLLFSL